MPCVCARVCVRARARENAKEVSEGDDCAGMWESWGCTVTVGCIKLAGKSEAPKSPPPADNQSDRPAPPGAGQAQLLLLL